MISDSSQNEATSVFGYVNDSRGKLVNQTRIILVKNTYLPKRDIYASLMPDKLSSRRVPAQRDAVFRRA